MLIRMDNGEWARVIAKCVYNNTTRIAYCITTSESENFDPKLRMGECPSDPINEPWRLVYGKLPKECIDLYWVGGLNPSIEEFTSGESTQQIDESSEYLFPDL